MNSHVQQPASSNNNQLVTAFPNRNRKSNPPITSTSSNHVISFVPSQSTITSHNTDSVPVTFSNKFATNSFSLQANQFEVPNPTTSPQNFSLMNGFTFLSSSVPSKTHLASKPKEFSRNQNTDKFIATDGGLFVPETNVTKVKIDDNLQKRQNLFFTANSGPRPLIENDLLTPGKMLQQTGSQNRNLAALSPDTVDFVLNVDLHKPGHSEVSRNIPKQLSRPSSYPSLTSADLEDLASFADSFQVPTTTTTPFRSGSFGQHQTLSNSSDLESNSRDRSVSCHVTQSKAADKKSSGESSFEFSPGDFLKSFDHTMSYTTSTISSQSESQNGGVFVPHFDSNSVLSQPRGTSVSCASRHLQKAILIVMRFMIS